MNTEINFLLDSDSMCLKWDQRIRITSNISGDADGAALGTTF